MRSFLCRPAHWRAVHAWVLCVPQEFTVYSGGRLDDTKICLNLLVHNLVWCSVLTWHVQVLDALVGLGMRTQVTPGVLLAAARALDGVPEPCEEDAARAARLLARLDEAATQGARTCLLWQGQTLLLPSVHCRPDGLMLPGPSKATMQRRVRLCLLTSCPTWLRLHSSPSSGLQCADHKVL